MKIVRISFACNNPDDGSGQGWFEQASFYIGENHLYVEGKPTVFRHTSEDVVRVGRLTVPIAGYRAWHGNWCWDAIWVNTHDANRIANYLRKRKFRPDQGMSNLWDAWEADAPLDFATAVQRSA